MGRYLDALRAKKNTQAPPIPPIKPIYSNLSVLSGGHPRVSEKTPPPVEGRDKLAADEFLSLVTRQLGVDVRTLLKLGILVPQDLVDLDGGMYGPEHIAAYRDTVAKRLSLEWGNKVALAARGRA